MDRMIHAVVLTFISSVLMPGCGPTGAGAPCATSRPAGRLGVYETRAIAVAWARSKYNTRINELTADYKRAEAADDRARMRELKRQANIMQGRLHQQAFGRAPVDDLLIPISDRIPAICDEAGVERLVPIWSFEALWRPTVDVTDQLVAEYQPSVKTLKTIGELRKHPPMLWVGHCD
jgi:hypothetical protein